MPPDGGTPGAIGRYLARQRRLRGIGLDELAALTRIPIRSLERLEAGAFDGEADGFARGFVRTVATAIGLDADEAVSRMLKESVVESGVSFSTLGRAVLLLGGVLAALFVGLFAVQLWRTSASAPAEPSPLPVRRDAVRALALQEGLRVPDRVVAEDGTPPTALVPGPPSPAAQEPRAGRPVAAPPPTAVAP